MPHTKLPTYVLMVLVSAVLWISPAAPPSIARAADRSQSETDMAHSILVALNQWRIAQQLWPLQPNATLDTLALEQASYLQGLGDALPYDRIHEGPDGSDPPTRARRAGWPTYGRDDFTAITEIGKIGPDAQDAMSFWTTSSTHLHSISNPVYREIGIAAVPHEYGFITIVMLGARPDVLPALVDDEAGVLYLSNERYRGSTGFSYLSAASQVQVFDASGRPLQAGWTAWQPTVTLPGGVHGPLVVAYTDGTRQTLALVDPAQDRIDGPAAGARPTANQPPGPVAQVPVPVAQSQPASAPPPAALPPDIRIAYDANSLAVINLTNARQDWSGLALVQGANRLNAAQWNNLGGFAMASVPPHACIQVVDPALAAFALPPSGCTSYYAQVQINASGRFWASDSFEVHSGGQVIGHCPAQNGLCEVALP